MKNLFQLSSAFLLAIMLSACGGPTGGTDGASDGSTSINAQPGINLAVVEESSGDSTISFTTDQTGIVEVIVLDENGNPVASQIVNFAVSIGSAVLSQASDLTESNGSASVRFTHPGLAANTSEPGVITVTSDSFEPVTVTYQFISSTTTSGSTSPTLSIRMTATSDGQETNRIATTDSANVEFTLLDGEGDPLADKILNISATSGELSQPQVLTNSSGQFAITLEPPAGLTQGTSPGIITVASQEGLAEEASQTYEFIASTSSEPEDTSSVGSIAFVSASPQVISLKGTGGAGFSEVSQVKFIVKDNNDNPIQGVRVFFNLTTTVGGLSLQADDAITGTDGSVTAFVNSGTIATPVRVTASVTLEDGTPIFVQSDQLTLTTGIPDQNSVSLSVETFAPEAWNEDGVTTSFNMRLADRFNNPVPDGTVVNFTTEGGRIDGSCVTSNSACSVTWESQDFRPADHRVTVLATVIGHETYYDKNGSGIFDDGDSFDDLAEAFRDDDENGEYNPNLSSFSIDEKYIDYDGDGVFSDADGLFNGVPCEHPTLCAPDANNLAGSSNLLTTLNESATIIMASSSPQIFIYELLDGVSCLDADGKIQGLPVCSNVNLEFAEGKDFKTLWVLVQDDAGLCLDASNNRVEEVNTEAAACERVVRQSAPTNSAISVSVSDVTLEVDSAPANVPNTTSAIEFTALISSDDTNRADIEGAFSVEVTTPSGAKVFNSLAVIDVKDPTPISDANETFEVEVNTRIVDDVLANLTDEDSESHSITSFTVAGDATNYAPGATANLTISSGGGDVPVGTIRILEDGSFVFTPEVDYIGFVPEITYNIVDDNDATDTDSSILFISLVEEE